MGIGHVDSRDMGEGKEAGAKPEEPESSHREQDFL